MAEVASALVHAFEQGVPLLVGHGSGSFGHSAAAKHGTMDGVRTADQWIGFAEVAFVARQLNTLVVDALASAGLPIFAFQPSASARCRDGVLESMEVTPLTLALSEGLVPVVYGDVAFDSVRGRLRLGAGGDDHFHRDDISLPCRKAKALPDIPHWRYGRGL